MESEIKQESQAAETAPTRVVGCPKCSTNVLETGFIVREIRYQAYLRREGKLFKSHKAKGGCETTVCMLCSQELLIPVAELTKAA